MRDVSLIQKELSELTGLRATLESPNIKMRLGQVVLPAHNDSRVIFQLPGTAQAIFPALVPGQTPYWGLVILVIASYDVPGFPYNLTKDKVGQIITVWSREPVIQSLDADKTYQGYVTLALPPPGDPRPPKFWIRDIIEIPADEDERLQDILEQIRILEEKLAALRAEIARLKEKAGMTAEDEARLADLQRLIDQEKAKIADIEVRIPPAITRVEQEKAAIERLRGEIPAWNARIEAARTLRNAMERQESGRGLSWNWNYRVKAPYEACKPLWDPAIERFSRQSTCSNNMYALLLTIEGKLYAGWYCRPSGSTDIPNAQVVDTLVYHAQGKIADLESRIRDHTATLHNLEGELRDLQDELEYAKRRLGDAIAALKRAELEIRRAIALREAEVEAAMARYELELRTLENLKATYSTLLKEIELARTQAIAEAARQREEMLRAQEKERLRIAEEQRIKAEEAERKALETAGVSREEYLDEMRRALEIAKEAQEAAIASAKEREEIAKEIAAKEAELARMELELEELRREQAGTEERKEEAEKEVAGLPAIPTWGWAALGITGATLSAVGIGYALKKKKRK